MSRKTSENYVHKKLLKGYVTFGTWLSVGNEAIAEIFANAEYDWVVIDLEHTCMTEEKAEKLIRVVKLAGSVPLVRLTNNCENQIKRVMDAGAGGIVVPRVNSECEAIQAIAATRYPPNGIRGVGLARAQGYGTKFLEYVEWQKKSPIVFVQIEDQAALPEIHKIFKVPGVTGFLIGPYDLSCSLGIPGEFKNKKYIKTVKTILKAGANARCPAGMHIVEPDLTQLKKVIQEGYKIIAYSVDFRMLDQAARAGVKFFKSKKK
ncbi:MAG: 2,4-dihydroxyhept-2-ene-1,7-dioic acid aldolase [Chitinophagia bacterium]|nr:2,4-dihydroxyhept-2-ene-1,7-dioic acid aldolase [Chitinophagia bacterium]